MKRRADIKHGTNWSYCHHGCRCDECRMEHNRVNRVYGTNVRVGKRAEQKRADDRRRAEQRKAAA